MTTTVKKIKHRRRVTIWGGDSAYRVIFDQRGKYAGAWATKSAHKNISESSSFRLDRLFQFGKPRNPWFVSAIYTYTDAVCIVYEERTR